jgi:putative endonuclease
MTASLRGKPLASGAAERRMRLRRGRVSEAFAAAVLIAKGYRILGRRVKTRAGEIDIIAVRGTHPPRIRSLARAAPALPRARLCLRPRGWRRVNRRGSGEP